MTKPSIRLAGFRDNLTLYVNGARTRFRTHPEDWRLVAVHVGRLGPKNLISGDRFIVTCRGDRVTFKDFVGCDLEVEGVQELINAITEALTTVAPVGKPVTGTGPRVECSAEAAADAESEKFELHSVPIIPGRSYVNEAGERVKVKRVIDARLVDYIRSTKQGFRLGSLSVSGFVKMLSSHGMALVNSEPAPGPEWTASDEGRRFKDRDGDVWEILEVRNGEVYYKVHEMESDHEIPVSLSLFTELKKRYELVEMTDEPVIEPHLDNWDELHLSLINKQGHGALYCAWEKIMFARAMVDDQFENLYEMVAGMDDSLELTAALFALCNDVWEAGQNKSRKRIADLENLVKELRGDMDG